MFNKKKAQTTHQLTTTESTFYRDDRSMVFFIFFQKIFTVPSTAQQAKIPFARVNHAKYMVTDRVVYIGTVDGGGLKESTFSPFTMNPVQPMGSDLPPGTSNWSETYFTQTAGVGLVVNQTGSEVQRGQQTLQSQVEALFLRDWTSEYATALSLNDEHVCPRRSH